MGKKEVLQGLEYKMKPTVTASKPTKAASVNSEDKNIDEEKTLINVANNFNQWIEQAKFPVNKLLTVRIPGMRLGTVASEEIQSEQVTDRCCLTYVRVPDD